MPFGAHEAGQSLAHRLAINYHGPMGSTDQAQLSRHRLTVQAYYRMGEAGVLEPDARVELIDGEIIDMSPIGSVHASLVNRLTRMLISAVGDRAIVQIQGPLTLDEHTQLQPDLALLKPRSDYYRDAVPGAADVLLVVEVADTSLEKDRSVKLPLFAAHGVPEAWLVDVPDRLVGIYREPEGALYRSQSIASPGKVELSQLSGVLLDLGGLL
jgi:Uma2 family endonuclease